jgi:RNA polymerase sigma factor (TIGR02999 family)
VPPASSTQVTELLHRWSGGDAAARDALVPLVYDELRRLARHFLASRRSDHTLQSTAIVHEAYLRLAGRENVHWENRAHFFAVTAQLMRRILVDHARKRNAAKRGGANLTLLVEEPMSESSQRELDLVALDDALNTLALADERQSRIVELRFFAGLSIEDTSRVLEISPATVKREWATARAWLCQEITGGLDR